MKSFEVLEHTADAKFRAFGKDMQEAFMNAAYATVSLMYDPEMVAALEIESFSVEGKDMKQLLYNFLEELLFLQDSKQFVIHSFVKAIKIAKAGEKFRLRAEVIGDTIKADYEVRPVAKAITYAEMEISEKPLYVQFVVDI